jgi:type II secretory pathway pseudopilin PulG
MRPLPQLDRKPSGRHGSARVDEAGFMLLAAVVMVAVLLIALSVAAPIVARQLRRDKEIESQHRMEQYVRAIQLYQRKFPGQYPASIKILENTNNVRFLRHVYVDPLTGKADYKLIHQGEQQTKIHVFFGKELDGLAASLGSAAGMQSGGGLGAASSGPTNVTSTNALNSGFGGSTIGGSSSYGSSSPTSSGTSGTAGTNGTTGSNGSNGSTSGPSSTSTDDLGSDSLGVIVGVGTSKSGTSITEPNAQTTYESWEFWYDPRIEMLKQGVNVTGGGMSSQSASGFGSSATSGQPNTGGLGMYGTAAGAGGASGTSTSGTTGTTSTTGTSGTSGSTNPNNPFSSPF